MGLQKVEFLDKEGSFVRDCPGTKYHICCGYKNIDLIEGCILSCSYCILKHYIKGESIKVNLNIKDIINEVDDLIEKEKKHILRFGTGELSDSLALDKKYCLNQPLIEYFHNKKKAIFELKSKWAQIEHLTPYLNPYTVISFSVAPQQIIEKEEKKTSPLYKRLKALRKAQDLGCFIGIHFDPIIIYEGFERDYYWLIEDIGRILDTERIIWISLGLLRFPAKMMEIFIEEKRKNLLYGEFIRGEDQKYRYIKSERIRVYKTIYNLLKNKNEKLFIYLCMERSDIWKNALGINLNSNEDLITLFDQRVKHLFGGMI